MPQPEASVHEPEPTAHAPADVRDVLAAIKYLRHAFHGKLPDELLKHILYHADYDCLHFTATSSQEVTQHGGFSGTKLSDPVAYVETEPLSGLPGPHHGGRIRSLRLYATGKDQGWVTDHNSASWSWFEVRKRRDDFHDGWQGFEWVRNNTADATWQHHDLVYHVDDEAIESEERVGGWVSGLRNGDRVSIVPMAQYPSWECNVREAGIDIEVEVWR